MYLDLSPNQAYFALYDDDGTVIQNLSSIYPRAIVKAIELADDEPVRNCIDKDLRVFVGNCLKTGKKLGPRTTSFTYGAFAYQSVKSVLDADPKCVKDYFFNHSAVRSVRYDGRAKFRANVVDAKAWILWYCPEFARKTLKGAPIFDRFHYEKHTPRKSPLF